MSILVVAEGWDGRKWVERLKRLAPERDFVLYPDTPSGAVHYALVWKPPPGLLASLPELRAIVSMGAGVDHVLRDPDLPDVPLARSVDPSLTRRMTEWVCLQVLSQHRRAALYRTQQREKVWKGHGEPMAADVGVGVMGLGELGRDSVEKLSLLGFDVAGWSRSRREIAGVTCFAGSEEFDAFLARTDILVSLLPLTPDTRGLIGRRLISGLRSDNHMGGAVVINAGRGEVQVEADIIAALDEGALAAAVLDVFATEPLPADNPLWSHPKVTITPHNSADSDPNYLCAYLLRQIAAHERGEPMENIVDRRRGY